MSGQEAARLLRERAESYSTDAGVLRQSGATDDALIYEAIRDELRKIATEVNHAVTATCGNLPQVEDRRHGCRICRGGTGDFVCHVCMAKQR